MRPEDLPIHAAPSRLGAESLDERIMVELPADFYSLEELEAIVSVLRKYRAVCQLLEMPAGSERQQ